MGERGEFGHPVGTGLGMVKELAIAIAMPEGAENGPSGGPGLKGCIVGEVKTNAAEVGLGEVEEAHAREAESVEVIGEGWPLNPRRAKDTPSPGPRAVDVQLRQGLGKDGGGIEPRGNTVTDGGRGRDEISLGTGRERRGKIRQSEPGGGLGVGEAVDKRQLTRRDEGETRGVGGRAVGESVAGDRPVADHAGEADFSAGLKGQLERREIGVATNADVLQVDDEEVESGQKLGRGLAQVAVEGVDRNAPERVRDRVGTLPRGGKSEVAVLRREERAEVVAEDATQGLSRGLSGGEKSGPMREQPNLERGVCGAEPGLDAGGHLRPTRMRVVGMAAHSSKASSQSSEA